ncbi:MAG: hypothetical protein DHS80DRAFT_15253 [Piptocephalis tieghemiana]|nr:MAG: hypothetical protein DHS80DRAFT_15253 [Piptocephalis tieghemiana]
MHDFMNHCLHAWLRATGWDEHNQFSSLHSPSKAILDFAIPRGFLVTASKHAFPHLASSVTFAPVPSTRSSTLDLSYLYTSRSLNLPSPHQRPHADLSRPLPEEEPLDEQGKSIHIGSSLLYGRLFMPTADLEAMWVRRWSQRTLIRCMAFSSAKAAPNPSSVMDGDQGPLTALLHSADLGFVSGHLEYDGGRWSMEAMGNSDDALLGLRALYNFPRKESLSHADDMSIEEVAQGPDGEGMVIKEDGEGLRPSSIPTVSAWSVGGEMYYTGKEHSGGLSLGGRYRQTLPRLYEVTMTANPILGHLSTAYTLSAWRNTLLLSSRYEFNLHSYESDVCAGAEWRSGEDGVVRVRFGLREGLRLIFDGKYGRAWFAFGVGVGGEGKASTGKLGLQVQFIG